MDIDDFVRSLMPVGVTHESFRNPTEVYITADDDKAVVTVGEGRNGTHFTFEVVNGQLKTTVDKYTI